MTQTLDDKTLLELLYAANQAAQAEEDRERLAASLREFVKAGFPILKPERPYEHNWHIDAICAHLEAVTEGQIKRLQVWVPPGTMKSMNVSIFWPVWEWIALRGNPGLRFWCASHSLKLAWDHCDASRRLIESRWFQARWGHLFELTKSGERAYANDRGGTRSTTSPDSGGLGQHGDRIILDDLLDAGDSESTTRAVLDKTNDWYDTVIAGRKETDAAEVLIMQRLHENDPAAHALEVGEWTVLCLPERFEHNHPFAWRGDRVHPFVQDRLPDLDGDPRDDGELLWPAHRDEQASAEYAKRLTSFRAAGQLQQRPAAREGEILKRGWWRFYVPSIRANDEWQRLPVRFQAVIISVDTPLKDKQASDNVAVQCWGARGADSYLLDLRLGKMNYNAAKRTIREMAQWARRNFRGCPHYVLIENAGYGVELIIDLKRELSGVTKISPGAEGDKVMRATSASSDLESANCFLPGIGPPEHEAFNEAASPADIAEVVANCALFPHATHDDDVDAWSQMINWRRSRVIAPIRTSSAMKRLARR